MCDSGVSLTSCTEDSGLDRGLDTSDCDSPTAAGKGGHTVTIQVRIQNIKPVSCINNLEDWSARYFARTEKRFKEVVFTNKVTPQALTSPLTAVWVQYKPAALKSCSTSTGNSTRTNSSASTSIWSGSTCMTMTTLAVVYEYEAPAWQPEVAE